ncbi:unnamed protein product, partial [Onchocerca ochengi]|uniref:GRIP domain-containing protein n=1 Tax=Onchocerca ochengi TaxID=42157 RepID=A0A182EBX6_ONCOC
IRHTKTSALRLRSGSHESLSSIGGASSIASSRISKYNFATPRSIQRPLIISSARGQEDLFKTIQESLKEKETHLEQMIRERDIERNEMASLSNRCELAEAKATQLETAKTLVDQQLEALKVMLDESEAKFKTADSTVNDLTVQLKEKKDALEDLTFRYDEETILNAEMAEKIAELERRTVVKENENADTSKVLINEMEQIKLQLEELKKQCSAFEQEKLSICTGMKNILSACKQDFTELIQLLSSNDTIGSVNENETAAINDDQDLSKQMETNMKKLSSLLDYNKAVKKAIQEKLESNKEEIRNLASQLETLKKSVNDQTIITSQKDDELAICQTNVDQLRNELEKVERSKEKLKETCDALEISNNVLLENFDHLNKKDTEMAEKMENERKEYDAEITKLKEELWRAQNDAIQIKEQLHEMEAEKAKLMELRESLENSNRELLMDKESLESQKIELGVELRQKELERETLNSFLAKKEMELASTKSKIDDLSGQVDRLRANLCEASSSDESLKKELESLREENKKEAEAHSVQAAQLQINNESLEKELLATRNNFQSLENIHSAMKNTLGKTESELQKLKEMFSSSQQELVAEQEKVAKLQQEIVSHVSAVEHLQRLQKEEAASHAQTQSKLQSENDTTQKKLHDLEVDKEILLKEKTELQKEHAKVAERYQALTQSLKDRVSLDSDYKEKKVEIEELMAEKEKQASDLTMTVAKLSEFEQERNALAVSLNRLEKERKDKDAEFSVLKNELINIKDENKNKEDIINSLEAEVVALKEVIASMNKSNNETSIVSVKKKLELEQLEKERNDKHAELNVLKTEMINLTNDNKNKDSIINSLEAEVTMSKKENESLCQRISKLMADLSALNANSANNDRITEKELDITTVNVTQNEQYEEEINTLREEKNQAISQINLLKLEILELSKKQAENEEMVSEAKQRSALFIDFEEEWKNKETAYMQEIQELKIAVGKTETDKIEEMKRDISFLNSIIAEQYKKEKDLKDQITILNSLPANEIMTELQRKTTQEVSLRLYCDICEVFDLHDTTDCPAQAMAVEDEAIHQKTKKAKPPARPYCEQCEEFEHDTSNCPKMQIEKPKSKDYTF